MDAMRAQAEGFLGVLRLLRGDKILSDNKWKKRKKRAYGAKELA